LAAEVLGYAGFSDIEFNPKKSINCQARSVATFVALHARRQLERALSDKRAFLELLREGDAPDKLFVE
jgi:type I restriction enzyme M protein